MNTKLEKINGNNNLANNTLAQLRLLFPHLKNIPDAEIIKAISVAKYLGLNPLKKEVHFVPYGNTVQLIVGYTEYIKRANKSGKLNGWRVDFGKDDLDEYAEVIIWRKDWEHEFRWKVYLSEAMQNSPTWKKMPRFMLRKVAIAQAFRLAFPDETAHLPYEEAEITVEDIPNTYEREEDLEIPNVNESKVNDTKDNKKEFEEKSNGNKIGSNKNGIEKITPEQIKKIHILVKELGWTDEEYRNFLKRKCFVKSSKELTKAQASRCIEVLEEELKKVKALKGNEIEEDVPF